MFLHFFNFLISLQISVFFFCPLSTVSVNKGLYKVKNWSAKKTVDIGDGISRYWYMKTEALEMKKKAQWDNKMTNKQVLSSE